MSQGTSVVNEDRTTERVREADAWPAKTLRMSSKLAPSDVELPGPGVHERVCTIAPSKYLVARVCSTRAARLDQLLCLLLSARTHRYPRASLRRAAHRACDQHRRTSTRHSSLSANHAQSSRLNEQAHE